MSDNIYHRFARHMAMTGMPLTDGLTDLLEAAFTEEEAQVAMLLPAIDLPLATTVVADLSLPDGMDRDRVAEILEDLAARRLIFADTNKDGQRGYALHQAGFGFPQSFFWDGRQTAEAKKMSGLVLRYFNRDVTRAAFGGKKTKPYRYIPIHQSITPDAQAVLPHDQMARVLDGAHTFAVAHCPCRVQADLMARGCDHPREVCLKFDEMAQYLIDQGLGRQIDREEAGDIVRRAAGAGLVHFVDNAAGQVKHNCNCCGCACWNVGSIRRRKIPRDELMAVYFIRITDPDRCVGCGACIDICPVSAISLTDDQAVVDDAWCIGCGVCSLRCEFDALRIVYREGREAVPENFTFLHRQIRDER